MHLLEILSWNGSDYAWVVDNVGSGSTAEVRSNTLTVSGVSTFSNDVDLDVDGHTNLDNVSIALEFGDCANNFGIAGIAKMKYVKVVIRLNIGDTDTLINFL